MVAGLQQIPQSLTPWPVEVRFASGDCVVVEQAAGGGRRGSLPGYENLESRPCKEENGRTLAVKVLPQCSPSRARGSVAFGSLGDFVFHVPVEFSVRLA